MKSSSLLGLLLAFLISCSIFANACENPDTLTFSITPTEDTIQELTLYRPVIKHLQKITGKKIEFYMPSSYSTVVEAMLGGWVDIAVMGPYSYILANNRDENIQVFATYAKKPGYLQKEGPGYRAVLISKKGSRYTSIRSLKGAIVGLTDPASTSGNLVPRVVFIDVIKEDLESFFGKIVYTGGHDLSTLTVYEGKIDAAFVASHRFDNVIKRGLVEKSDFNFLWTSPALPQDPFTYRGSLCSDIKSKIKKAFLTLHTESSATAFLNNVNSDGFIPMTSADYNVIRRLAEAKKVKTIP